MEKVNYYLDCRRNRFSIESIKFAPIQEELPVIRIKLEDSKYLDLQSSNDVDEFCELLQEKKKEIWKS